MTYILIFFSTMLCNISFNLDLYLSMIELNFFPQTHVTIFLLLNLGYFVTHFLTSKTLQFSNWAYLNIFVTPYLCMKLSHEHKNTTLSFILYLITRTGATIKWLTSKMRIESELDKNHIKKLVVQKYINDSNLGKNIYINVHPYESQPLYKNVSI